MTPRCLSRPAARAAQLAGPNPIEYTVLFLVVVAGVLTYLR